MTTAVKPVSQRIAEELRVAEWQVAAAIGLLDGGSTVPFVARYRKEVTGGLDDAQLRELDERLRYLRDLDDRRASILESIAAQGALTDEVAQQINQADTKSRLEDIYLPFKPKRRTKAQIAREAGLEPLANALLENPNLNPDEFARQFIDPTKNINDAAEALDGARSIVVERVSEDADLVGAIRESLWKRGRIVSTAKKGMEESGAKYSDYFDFAESFTRLPSHRVLALLRGEKEGILSLTFDPEPKSAESAPVVSVYESMIAAKLGVEQRGRPGDKWLGDTVRWAWKTKLFVSASLDIRGRIRQRAERDAVDVFSNNVRDLLLAAPAGPRTTMGLDPAYRTGVKVAVVDQTGKVLDTVAVYPHKPQGQWDQAVTTLSSLVKKHNVDLIAIGNGTASRETDALAAELVKKVADRSLTKIVVSEAGASVYSASSYASKELPDLDVSLRGAVSIARRLQDPLAELVKIDPKSLGVGQYQHDISESLLERSLDAVVEDAVNAVGVDANMASAPLLARVSGITTTLAENIVAYRDEHGAFRKRSALKNVPRLGPKAFEQCAGFLRIADGDDPLDASSVHPEAYPVVRRIMSKCGLSIKELIGNTRALSEVDAAALVDDTFGVPTITDILAELDKPGRDPRPEFAAATFAEGIEKVSDLRPGMVLEGSVTNVAAFGAFVDIGVHQDGLVHVSAMANKFVSDPREIVRSGDVVKVKVTSVDVARNRIGLTLRLDDDVDNKSPESTGAGFQSTKPKRVPSNARASKPNPSKPSAGQPQSQSARREGRGPEQGALADALRRAGYKGKS
ncbi:RNA-binding transcriptional accessory protein [Hoyosella rhizosphaerae]|uniref:Tex family protein n=1 Tax=Hoyosella rhizosphaerae TaxID=1755582 RepID=UPI0016678959|nr:Tex family protein [Hoyosella rhizosphaerae]MBN4926241.1 RNA-binding transcriptional accessory protein [Hoyosella rhizosphaerae]